MPVFSWVGTGWLVFLGSSFFLFCACLHRCIKLSKQVTAAPTHAPSSSPTYIPTPTPSNLRLVQPAVHFGKSFSGLESSTVDTSCEFRTGQKICCLNESISLTPRKFSSNECKTSRKYFSSRYELEQLEIARNFDSQSNDSIRTLELLNFFISEADLNHSFNWVERVKKRMTLSQTEVDDIDQYYLSRFLVTRSCAKSKPVTWLEYIEPISMHVRNPFSLLNSHKINKTRLSLKFPEFSKNILGTGMMNNDYILLASVINLPRGLRSRIYRRKFFFDAGTSTFQSSLWWFTCMYQKMSIDFDELFGWEYTLLEPKAFWDEVPIRWREKYHFYNTNMSADIEHGNSPLRMIKSVATDNDFVSFKLDIDNPEVEIPTVLRILEDKDLHDLIDEFFFEVHFRCEFLMHSDWWGDAIPESISGLSLHRSDVMNLFIKLRQVGIRAHIWP